MRRLLILTLPLVLTAVACDEEEGDGGGDDNGSILDLTGDPAAGEAVFSAGACATSGCHGADGNSGTAPALNSVVSSRTDDQLIDAVLDGKGTMPPNNLSDQEMADVLAWLRSAF